MASWGAVKAAIATQMSTAVGIRYATSTDLINLSRLPTVFVFHVAELAIHDEHGGVTGAYEARKATIEGALVCPKPGELKRAIPDVDALMEALWVRARTGIKLGLDYVEWCLLTNTKQGEITLGSGQDAPKFPGATITWDVGVFEAVDRMAKELWE